MKIQHSSGKTGSAILAAWLLSLGFDFFLHGGLLAQLYVEPTSFLLDPEVAFRRIPLGYLTFLILTSALLWLFRQLGVRGGLRGLGYGIGVGSVVWGALALGLYSISTATLSLLAAWWIGQTAELGLAGLVLGAAEQGMPLTRLWLAVLATVAIFVVSTILLQSFGLAPVAS